MSETKDSSRNDIIMFIDESGSMTEMGKEPVEAVNAFIEEQKKVEDDSTITIYKFNTNYTEFCVDKPLKEFDVFDNYNPSGMTSLYDAIGNCISKKEKTKGVTCLIITDGKDNASKKYNKKSVSKLIKNTEGELGWKYIYLGANQDSFEEGNKLGISFDNCHNFSTRKGPLKRYTSMPAKFDDEDYDNLNLFPPGRLELTRNNSYVDFGKAGGISPGFPPLYEYEGLIGSPLKFTGDEILGDSDEERDIIHTLPSLMRSISASVSCDRS